MISKNNQQGDVNSGVVSRFDQGKAISSLRNGTNVNQIRGINVANATGSGIPKHVTNVNTSLANATTGSTTTVTVTFRRDPTDKTFSGVAVLVKGYQGNPSPVQLASGSDSPINFILNNTGEALSLTVQATGNGGAAPLNTAPTVGLSLPKNSAGGTGTTTINSALTLKTNGVANGSQTALNLAAGSNITVTDNGSGTDTIAATIPNLPASQITSGQLALARGGTAVDLSASGSATAILAQDASHVITARALVAADIPSLSATYLPLIGGTLSGGVIASSAGYGVGGSAGSTQGMAGSGSAITLRGSTVSLQNSGGAAGGNIVLGGKVTSYNGVATVSNGVPAEYATVDLTAQAAAITATTLYAVPSTGAGMYRISWVASVTQAATTSSTLGGAGGFQIQYTDKDDSVVKTSPSTVVAGVSNDSTNTTATAVSGSIVVSAKASTNIQYQMGYTTSGVTAMQFNLHIKCEAL